MSSTNPFENNTEASGLVEVPNAESKVESIPEPEAPKKTNLAKDKWNICLLFVLYFLQGVPLGLCGSISAILTFRGIPYSALGTFSFVYWPFSLKLLW